VDSTRRTAIATGVLLIVATAAALAAAAVEPALTGTTYLTDVADHPNRLAIGAVLYLIAAGTSVGIAIALYPLLKKVNGPIALGSVVFRTIEAVFYAAAVVSLLTVLHLGQQLASASADSPAAIHALGDSLLSTRDNATLSGVLAFCVGAFMYYTLFYRSRLIPRWLFVWGLTRALLMMTACLLALFNDNSVTGHTFLILPILVQEMALALWLLAKGFSPSPHASRPSTKRATAHRRPTAV
jgi:hypothetical protein